MTRSARTRKRSCRSRGKGSNYPTCPKPLVLVRATKSRSLRERLLKKSKKMERRLRKRKYKWRRSLSLFYQWEGRKIFSSATWQERSPKKIYLGSNWWFSGAVAAMLTLTSSSRRSTWVRPRVKPSSSMSSSSRTVATHAASLSRYASHSRHFKFKYPHTSLKETSSIDSKSLTMILELPLLPSKSHAFSWGNSYAEASIS